MPTLLDKNVIFNIAVGNVPVAEALKSLLASGETVYMSRVGYKELVEDSPVRFRMGYELLLKDLKITLAPATVADIKARGSFIADNMEYVPPKGKPGRIDTYSDKAEKKPGDAYIAAEAKALKAKLWTLDEKLAKRAENQGVTPAPECKLKSRGQKKDESIAQARRLMGLKPLSMLQNPNPTRTTSGPSGSSSTPPSSSSSSAAGPKAKAPTAQVGDPVGPIVEHGPNAAGDAKFQGATLAIEGVNFLLQKFNNVIQARRFQEAWKSRWEGEVRRRLDADPQLGALISIYYSKDKGDAESAIDTVTIFLGIRVGFGLDRAEAVRDLISQSSISGGRADVGDTVWIRPREPMDIGRLKLPFGCAVAGLATFVPGKAELVRVQFSSMNGFDEKWFSTRDVDVPAGTTPRFYYLWPPDEVVYFRDGKWRTEEVGWKISRDADVSHGQVDPVLNGVPAVKLDSSINPYDFAAAMVWPADNTTANLFQRAGAATDDKYGLLDRYGIGPMRWVKPECIRILKAPIATPP
jgi:predicted nucleic acid-binding protein